MATPSRSTFGLGTIAGLLLVVILFLVLLGVASWTPTVLTISFALVAIALLFDRYVTF